MDQKHVTMVKKKKNTPVSFFLTGALSEVRMDRGQITLNPPPLFRGPTDESFFGDGRQTQYLGLNEDSMQKVDNDTPRPYIKLSQLKI